MAKKLKIAPTEHELIQRKAHEMKLNAALGMTRLKPKMRRAVRLVLLDGFKQPAAGRRVGCPKQHVYRALLVVKPILAEIEAYALTLRKA